MRKRPQVGRADGDAAAALARAVRRVEADYTVPFLAHATMEPQTCTAHVRPDGVEVWAPTQDAATALATAAFAAGVPNDKVVVHRTMLGGGFGRRGAIQEYVRQAVLIAKEVDAAGQARVDARRGRAARSSTGRSAWRASSPASMPTACRSPGPYGLPDRHSSRRWCRSFGTSFIDRSLSQRADRGNAL